MMTDKEKLDWVNLKITNETFKKTPEEKKALHKAKQEHKKFIKSNLTYSGVK